MGSIKAECLAQMVPIEQWMVRRVLRDNVDHGCITPLLFNNYPQG